MVLSPNWNTVPVRAKYLNSDGTPVSGSITFTPSAARLIDAAALITIVPRTIRVTLNAQGAFEVNIPATDDPDITPIDFTYAVKEEFVGGSTYNIEVPLANAESGINLTSIAPVANPSSGLLVIPMGPAGPAGPGVPAGGTTGQGLIKTSSADFDTEWGTVSGGGGTSDHGALTGLADDDHTQYLNNTRGDVRYYTKSQVDTSLGSKANSSHTHSSSQVTDLTEAVQDVVGAMIVAGTDITVSYNDTTGVFTINSTASGGGGGTDTEIVRDTIAAALVASTGIQITVNDASDTITIASTSVPTTRTVTAGTGLTGGGDLSANRTLAVSFGSTSTTVAAGNHNHDAAYTIIGHGHDIADITDLQAGLDEKALETHTHVAADITGALTLAQMAPGGVFMINFVDPNWRYNNTTITARPSSRTDIRMMAVGGTTPPSFGITHDMWFEEV